MRANKDVNNFILIFMKQFTLSSIIVRMLFFSFIWWVLTNGDASSWWIGLPAVILKYHCKHKTFTSRTYCIS